VIWDEVVTKKVTGVSVRGMSLAALVGDRMTCWSLVEISLTLDGADRGARIDRAWEETLFYAGGQPSRDGRSAQTVVLDRR
jgi:hypothetical protein